MKNTFFHFCFDKRRKLAPSIACIEDLHYICTYFFTTDYGNRENFIAKMDCR